MKKILLGLGVMTAVAAPVVATVSCGSKKTSGTNDIPSTSKPLTPEQIEQQKEWFDVRNNVQNIVSQITYSNVFKTDYESEEINPDYAPEKGMVMFTPENRGINETDDLGLFTNVELPAGFKLIESKVANSFQTNVYWVYLEDGFIKTWSVDPIATITPSSFKRDAILSQAEDFLYSIAENYATFGVDQIDFFKNDLNQSIYLLDDGHKSNYHIDSADVNKSILGVPLVGPTGMDFKITKDTFSNAFEIYTQINGRKISKKFFSRYDSSKHGLEHLNLDAEGFPTLLFEMPLSRPQGINLPITDEDFSSSGTKTLSYNFDPLTEHKLNQFGVDLNLLRKIMKHFEVSILSYNASGIRFGLLLKDGSTTPVRPHEIGVYHNVVEWSKRTNAGDFSKPLNSNIGIRVLAFSSN